MKAKGFAHKVISYGPGGFKCSCCGPAPGMRREERQHNRRVLDRVLDSIEREELKHEEFDWFMFPEFEWDEYFHGELNGPCLHEEWQNWKRRQI